MLQTIREAIENLPDKSFGQFYQEYVKKAQDKIIRKDISFASTQLTSLEDTTDIVKGLNTLTEELERIW